MRHLDRELGTRAVAEHAPADAEALDLAELEGGVADLDVEEVRQRPIIQ